MLSRSKAELFKCSADALCKRGGAHLQEPTVGFRPWEGVGQDVNLQSHTERAAAYTSRT
jgi:hypothetical protein